MKKPVKLNFYAHLVTPSIATFDDWTPIAEKIVKLLNTDLGENYPDAFFFLQKHVKGKVEIYAGSMEEQSYRNDPKFLEVLEQYDPPSASGDYKDKRRKGS